MQNSLFHEKMKRVRQPGEKNQKAAKDNYKYQFRLQRIPAPVVPNVLPSVALSEYDKASQLTLSKDQLSVYGCEVGEFFFTVMRKRLFKIRVGIEWFGRHTVYIGDHIIGSWKY